MTIELPDIQVFGVYERNVPNQERIVLRVNRPTSLTNYILILGVRGPLGSDNVIPLPDQSLWLGSTFIGVPSWIFIYTGRGTPGISQEMNTKEPVHTVFWNKNEVVLTHDDIVPALLHIDHVQIGNRPNLHIEDLRQTPANPGTIDLAKLLRTVGDADTGRNKDPA